MKKHNRLLGLQIGKTTPEALRCLIEYDWRGNIRELENCIERALVLTESDAIDLISLPDPVRGTANLEDDTKQESIEDDNLSIKQQTRTLEVRLIKKALAETKGKPNACSKSSRDQP